MHCRCVGGKCVMLRCQVTGACVQGLAAFKLNVQLSHEYNDKLAKAAGKFRNQLVGSAFESWKQHAQHNKLLQSRLGTAVGVLRHRGIRAAFTGWREAAAIRKEHKHKVPHWTALEKFSLQ